jgi:DDE superfamily endonuclease
MDSLIEDAACVEPLAVLSRFRRDFHACLTARADELSELADAVLCADGPVRDLAGLSLAAEHRRGHGALYDAVNHGRWTSAGCAGRWPGCRYRAQRTGGWCWPPT